MKNRWHVFLSIIPATVIAGCSNFYADWKAENVSDGGRVLCSKEVDGDYFFVERVGDSIKTGSLIDVTGAGGDPKSFIVSWGFRDSKGQYLETSTPPKDLKKSYIKIDRNMYAENVSYHHLHLKTAKSMSISIELKKYDNPGDVSNIRSLDEISLDNIDLCVVDII